LTKVNDLPTGIYFKHGGFYRVSKNVWLRIGETLEQAQRHPAWVGAQHVDAPALIAVARKVRRAAKMNAKHGRRQIPFELTEADVETLLIMAKWRCAVTGVDFSLERIAGKRPYAPSIDRIDCAKGYTLDNCRMVCVAANIAMNVWGPEILRKLAESMQKSSNTRLMSN
jgi:hypothetical protein